MFFPVSLHCFFWLAGLKSYYYGYVAIVSICVTQKRVEVEYSISAVYWDRDQRLMMWIRQEPDITFNVQLISRPGALSYVW